MTVVTRRGFLARGLALAAVGAVPSVVSATQVDAPRATTRAGFLLEYRQYRDYARALNGGRADMPWPRLVSDAWQRRWNGTTVYTFHGEE